MERRYEPMGGEEDSYVPSSNPTDNNYSIPINNNSSTLNENFEDDLTLKVRYLLLNLDESEGVLQKNDISVNRREKSEFKRNSVPFHCDDDINSEYERNITLKNVNLSFEDQDLNCIAIDPNRSVYTQFPASHAAQDGLYKYPPILVVDHVESDVTSRAFEVKTKEPNNTVSYHTFSNVLQNADKFMLSTPEPDFYQETQACEENKFSAKSLTYTGITGKSKFQDTEKKHISSSSNSKSSHASSLTVASNFDRISPEREAERSWSEITVTNESFKKVNRFSKKNESVGTNTSKVSNVEPYISHYVGNTIPLDSRQAFLSRDEYVNYSNDGLQSLRQISLRRTESDDEDDRTVFKQTSARRNDTNPERFTFDSRFLDITDEVSSRSSAATSNAMKTAQEKKHHPSKERLTVASRFSSEASVSGLNSNRLVHEVEREYDFLNFCSVSSVSDRETPPLSASSVASSRRLEWDNGADIGYVVAGLSAESGCKRMIPKMARSEPEGISLLNDSSQTTLPSYTYPSLTEEDVTGLPSPSEEQQLISYGRFSPSGDMDAHSQQSSVEDDVLERSSSPGSLSRSDSKKSVIYNSVRDMHAKSRTSDSAGDLQPHRNLSCPNLTEVKRSEFSHDWFKARSEEQVGSDKKFALQSSTVKTYHYPNLNFQSNCGSGKAASSASASRRTSDFSVDTGQHLEDDNEGSMQTHEKETSPHTCMSCKASLSIQNHPNSSILANPDSPLNNLESLQHSSFDPSYTAPENDDNLEWYSETSSHDSDFNYIAGISEFSENDNFITLDSRPMFLLSNNSPQLSHGSFPKIVRSFFNAESMGDQTSIENMETEPHIRWYPFNGTPSVQDIKNVSTQTAVSYVAQQLKDSPVLTVSCQQTSTSESTPECPNQSNLSNQEEFRLMSQPNINTQEASTIFLNQPSVEKHETSRLDISQSNFSNNLRPNVSPSNLEVLEAYRLRLDQSNLNIQEALRFSSNQSSGVQTTSRFDVINSNPVQPGDSNTFSANHGPRNLDDESSFNLSLNQDDMVETSVFLSKIDSIEEYKEERRRPNLSGSSNPSSYLLTTVQQPSIVRSLQKEAHNDQLLDLSPYPHVADKKSQESPNIAETYQPNKNSSKATGGLSVQDENSCDVMSHTKNLEDKNKFTKIFLKHSSEKNLTENALPDSSQLIFNISNISSSERKLGVGECQTIPKTLEDNSTAEVSRLKRNLPAHSFSRTTPRTSSSTSSSNGSTNVKNIVLALNQSGENIPHRSSETNNKQPKNFVRTAVATLNDLPHFEPQKIRAECEQIKLSKVQSDIASTIKQHLTINKPNLLEFLSENNPDSWSKHPNNAERITKSLSDPLLSDKIDSPSRIKNGHIKSDSKTNYESQQILFPKKNVFESHSFASQTDARLEPNSRQTDLTRKEVDLSKIEFSTVEPGSQVSKLRSFIGPTIERNCENRQSENKYQLAQLPSQNIMNNFEITDHFRKGPNTSRDENSFGTEYMKKPDGAEDLRVSRFSSMDAQKERRMLEDTIKSSFNKSLELPNSKIVESSNRKNEKSFEAHSENAAQAEIPHKISNKSDLQTDFAIDLSKKEVDPTKKERRKWELADPFSFQLERNKINYSRTSEPKTDVPNVQTESSQPGFLDKFALQPIHRTDNSWKNTFSNKNKTQKDLGSQDFPQSQKNVYARHSFGSQTECDYTKSSDIPVNRNCTSIGIQVPSPVPDIERCSFCSMSKNASHLHCPQRDIFKTVLNQSLEMRLAGLKSTHTKSGASFCVFSARCVCCCNRTLQEAFNFHHPEIVEKIEARKTEVENKMHKGLFVNQALQRNPNNKLKAKPVNDRKRSIDRPSSNKENIKKYDCTIINSNKQRSRHRNLIKYNRVMSKLYSQRLKNEILKGKVSFHRHEVLMTS